MCNATPKVGEKWIFRRDNWWLESRDAEERAATGRSPLPRSFPEYEVRAGAVSAIDGFGVQFDLGDISEQDLFWRDGWEPFLRLEGETQEQPTATSKPPNMVVTAASWDEWGIRSLRMETPLPKPKVGERWLFDSKKRGIEASVWFGAVLAVGEGWWVLRDASRKPGLLTSAEWTPTHKLVG